MTHVNSAFFSGKIASMFMTPKGDLKVKLNIGSFKKGEDGKYSLRKDDDGKYINSTLTLYFFGEQAKRLKARFRPGDYVSANAFAQTTRNHYSCTNRIEFWGINMWPKKTIVGEIKPDVNSVHIVGKISSTFTTPTGLNLLTIFTSTNEEVLTPSGKMLPKNFSSYTEVSMGKRDIALYKKGDYIDVQGFVREIARADGSKACFIQVTKVNGENKNE